MAEPLADPTGHDVDDTEGSGAAATGGDLPARLAAEGTITHLLTLRGGAPDAIPAAVLDALEAVGIFAVPVPGHGIGIRLGDTVPEVLTGDPFALRCLATPGPLLLRPSAAVPPVDAAPDTETGIEDGAEDGFAPEEDGAAAISAADVEPAGDDAPFAMADPTLPAGSTTDRLAPETTVDPDIVASAVHEDDDTPAADAGPPPHAQDHPDQADPQTPNAPSAEAAGLTLDPDPETGAPDPMHGTGTASPLDTGDTPDEVLAHADQTPETETDDHARSDDAISPSAAGDAPDEMPTADPDPDALSSDTAGRISAADPAADPAQAPVPGSVPEADAAGPDAALSDARAPDAALLAGHGDVPPATGTGPASPETAAGPAATDDHVDDIEVGLDGPETDTLPAADLHAEATADAVAGAGDDAGEEGSDGVAVRIDDTEADGAETAPAFASERALAAAVDRDGPTGPPDDAEPSETRGDPEPDATSAPAQDTGLPAAGRGGPDIAGGDVAGTAKADPFVSTADGPEAEDIAALQPSPEAHAVADPGDPTAIDDAPLEAAEPIPGTAPTETVNPAAGERETADETLTAVLDRLDRIENALLQAHPASDDPPVPATTLTAQNRSFAALNATVATFQKRMEALAERIEHAEASREARLAELVERVEAVLARAGSDAAAGNDAAAPDATLAAIADLRDRLADPAAGREEFLHDLRVVVSELIAEARDTSAA